MRDRIAGVPDHAWEPPDALALPTIRDLAEESVQHAVLRLVGEKAFMVSSAWHRETYTRIIRLLIATAKTAVELEGVVGVERLVSDSRWDSMQSMKEEARNLRAQVEHWKDATGCEDPDAAADSMALLGEEAARLRQERDDACERSVLVAPAVDRLRDLEHRLGLGHLCMPVCAERPSVGDPCCPGPDATMCPAGLHWLRHDDLVQEGSGDPDEAGPAESSDTECGGGADPDRDRHLHVYGRMLRAYRLIRGAAIEATRGGEVSEVTKIGWRSRLQAVKNWVDAEAPASELDRALVEALAESPDPMPADEERAAIADWIEVELGGLELAALIRDAVHLEWEPGEKTRPTMGRAGPKGATSDDSLRRLQS